MTNIELCENSGKIMDIEKGRFFDCPCGLKVYIQALYNLNDDKKENPFYRVLEHYKVKKEK